MQTIRRLPFAAAAVFVAANLAAQITPGNLVVTRVGDGTTTLSNASTAVFLDEFTPTGVLVQTIAMPTSASGGNLPIANSGSATSEGAISQSVDGNYLITVGYGSAPGIPSIVGTLATAVPRVVARIGLDGVVDTSTALTDAYSGNNIRSAASLDGVLFWTAGTATAPNGPGVRFTTLGSSTSTQISSTLLNTRVVGIADGQLYCSSASGAFQGVSSVDTGLPTVGGGTITLLNGFPTSSGPDSYGFFFADATTLYVADARNTAAGGIQKWTLNAGSWTLAYTLNPAINIGCRGLSGVVGNGIVTLFATTTNNLLVSVTDNGAGSAFATLGVAPFNTAFRGVQFVRTPSRVTITGSPCATSFATPGITSSGGAPVLGNANFAFVGDTLGAFQLGIALLQAAPALPVGINIPGSPSCALIHVFADVLLGGLTDSAGQFPVPLPLPGDPIFTGANVSAQFAVLDFSLTGFSLPIGTSPALTITIGN